MGDEKDPNATVSSLPAELSPASVAPRPVSVVPRPAGASRMPPPPSSRGVVPAAPFRSAPPPPPQRSSGTMPPPSAPSSTPTVAASPSVVPRAPATPPPPPQRHSVPPSFARSPTEPPRASLTAQLEQRLGAAQLELRKLGSERHTLRSRLRREADRLQELESALRAEKELRRHAAEEHQAALNGLRTRLAELEAERSQERSRLEQQLVEALKSNIVAAPARSTKPLQGLRRIRGIGPAYQRTLEGLEITRVQQIASWTDADVERFAEQLRIRADRIYKDDWVGQAKLLEPDPE